uniref:Glycolipid transfer protein b n=1 Tax=Sinocyclocheilus anshuiensis TaxID=1608454 RepID=A0A671S910_9TELE
MYMVGNTLKKSVSFIYFPDCLGSKVFAPIKADINGNITKIKAVHDSDPVKYETLQQILLIEKSTYGSEWPKVGATLALSLRFIQILLQSLVDGPQEVGYHSWIVQKVFKVSVFSLSKDQEIAEEDCLAKIRQFLINFTATVDAIYEMYSVMNAELDYLV